ncbi:peroxidase family protein [Dactylosporangium sp. McL0621]|uniref:peroxidase family protein n=1 Tax=Dactylosporangium sp. McL0621 TaxID=3415678 RepID=UPI003CED447E
MPDMHDDDVPAGGAVPAHTVTRRDFGKGALGVAAVVGGLGTGAAADAAAGEPAAAAPAAAAAGRRRVLNVWEVRSLDGSGNNLAHPEWGVAESIYPRVAPAAYVDGIAQMPPGKNTRWISNRLFDDVDVTLYSARNVSAWGFVWGQFVDHTIALRRGRRQTGEDGDVANIPTTDPDPLERYRNDLDFVFMNRSIPAPGTGETGPREQINMASSYLDAVPLYGSDEARLNWLREGPADGDSAHSGGRLLMKDGYLPRRNARGDAASAPNMVIGAMPDPGEAVAAGDQRANENPMLLSAQTLFAREHNRIVNQLPRGMAEEDKFQIARAVVIAETQYITYNEWLPALGVQLPRYTGYRPGVNTSVTNEFATIGYRAHSMINPALEVRTEARRYDAGTVQWLRSLGIQVKYRGDRVDLVIPHGYLTFFQPTLIERLELGPALQGIGLTPMSNNDELITNRIRSLVAPVTDTLQAVNDLAAVDIERGRDHGFPKYNDIRRAFGLAPKTSFKDITGEDTEEFPADPLLPPGHEIDSPHCLDFVALYDRHGRKTTAEANNAVRGKRRTTLAARLKAVYGTVDAVDAFAGMVCERHRPDSEFGELQWTIWRAQFTALRDGDRFFYEINPLLRFVRNAFGIDYRTTLGDVIARNTDIPRHSLAPQVFFASMATAAEADGVAWHGEGEEPVAAPVVGAYFAAGATATDRQPWYCGRAEI